MSRSQSTQSTTQSDADVDVEVTDQATIELEFDAAPVVEHEPRPVFAAAAAYRPITMSIAVALLLVVGYGAYGVVSLFLPTDRPAPLSVAAAPADGIVATAPMPPVPATCERVDVEAFIDTDGNGHRTGREPALADVDVSVRGRGLGASGTTGPDGAYSIVLPAAPMTVRSTPRPGLWPGPRLPVHAGEAATVAASCDSAQGFIAVGDAAVVPVVSFDGPPLLRGLLDPEAPATEIGVQLHGRIWTDVDGDGVFTVRDRGVADTRLQIIDGDDNVLAAVTTTASGLYSFANLEPRTDYELRLSHDDLDLAGARLMGESRTDAWDRMWFRTGDPGLTIWGADFQLASD